MINWVMQFLFSLKNSSANQTQRKLGTTLTSVPTNRLKCSNAAAKILAVSLSFNGKSGSMTCSGSWGSTKKLTAGATKS